MDEHHPLGCSEDRVGEAQEKVTRQRRILEQEKEAG